jgi:hypothetical protein
LGHRSVVGTPFAKFLLIVAAAGIAAFRRPQLRAQPLRPPVTARIHVTAAAASLRRRFAAAGSLGKRAEDRTTQLQHLDR